MLLSTKKENVPNKNLVTTCCVWFSKILDTWRTPEGDAFYGMVAAFKFLKSIILDKIVTSIV